MQKIISLIQFSYKKYFLIFFILGNNITFCPNLPLKSTIMRVVANYQFTWGQKHLAPLLKAHRYQEARDVINNSMFFHLQPTLKKGCLHHLMIVEFNFLVLKNDFKKATKLSKDMPIFDTITDNIFGYRFYLRPHDKIQLFACLFASEEFCTFPLTENVAKAKKYLEDEILSWENNEKNKKAFNDISVRTIYNYVRFLERADMTDAAKHLITLIPLETIQSAKHCSLWEAGIGRNTLFVEEEKRRQNSL